MRVSSSVSALVTWHPQARPRSIVVGVPQQALISTLALALALALKEGLCRTASHLQLPRHTSARDGRAREGAGRAAF